MFAKVATQPPNLERTGPASESMKSQSMPSSFRDQTNTCTTDAELSVNSARSKNRFTLFFSEGRANLLELSEEDGSVQRSAVLSPGGDWTLMLDTASGQQYVYSASLQKSHWVSQQQEWLARAQFRILPIFSARSEKFPSS